MTETSGFMDPGTYDAAQFARAQFGHIKDGYQVGYLNELEVIAATPNAMSVVVKTGAAWVQGCWYTSDATNTLTIDAAHASLDRIDRIVLRKTATTSITAVVLKGTAAASPAAPTLTQTTDGVWEISLAQVLVTHSVTSIAGTGTTLITDERQMAYAAMGDATITSAGNLDIGTHRITSVSDPSGDQDADTKAARNAAITAALGAAEFTNFYGDESDGAISISTDTGSYSGLKQCTTFAITTGKTLTLTGNTVIMATTSITIPSGAVIDGSDAIAGGAGGAGGVYNGTVGSAGSAGSGAGHIVASTSGSSGTAGASGGNGGGGGGVVSSVMTTATALKLQSHALVFAILSGKIGGCSGGGGGGGGGSNQVGNHGGTGGDGGDGGACLILIAPTITCAGTIDLSGSDGAAGAAGTSGGGTGGDGGDGCGGILVLCGRTVTDTCTFTSANGGSKTVVSV